MKKPNTLGQFAEHILKIAVDEVIEDHRQKNVPIVVLKDNKMRILDLSPTTIKDKQEKYSSNNDNS